MEITNIILQFLKVLFSWPVITLVLVISFLKLFKGPISSFIRRFIKGEAYGVKIEASSPTEQRKEAEKLPQIQPEYVLEKYIKENPKEVIKDLIDITKKYHFERIFNIIYGTQISLLDYLNTRGDIGDKYINLVTYYNDYILRSKLFSAKIEDYFGFLSAMRLIEFYGERSNLSLRITPLGINFLSHIKIEYPATYKYKSF